MLEVKITAETPLEALATIAVLGARYLQNQDVSDAADRLYRKEQRWAAEQLPHHNENVLAPEPEVAPPSPAPPSSAEAPAPAPVSPPTFTLAQVSKAGADLIGTKPEKMGDLVGLLSQYGVQAIADLKEDQLGAFATALRGLGAKI